MNVQTRVDTTQLTSVSRLVSEVTGMVVQPNKAIVGRNAFAHEAGIHQHGVLEERSTYEIMTPESVGIRESNLVLGKHSGRHALRDRLKLLGISSPMMNSKKSSRILKISQTVRKISTMRICIHSLALPQPMRANTMKMVSVEFTGGSNVDSGATVILNVDGNEVRAAQGGDGPVNAALEAVKRCAGLENVTLLDYSISAITGGSDAQGRVNVRIDYDGEHFQGQSTPIPMLLLPAPKHL